MREVLSWPAEREAIRASHVFQKNAWKRGGETESKPGQGRFQRKELLPSAKKGEALPSEVAC